MTLPSLFDSLTPPAPRELDTERMNRAREAARRGIESAEASADPEWRQAAMDAIRAMPEGRQFLAEEVVPLIEANGESTHNRKALGPVILNAARAGLIVKTQMTSGLGNAVTPPVAQWITERCMDTLRGAA